MPLHGPMTDQDLHDFYYNRLGRCGCYNPAAAAIQSHAPRCRHCGQPKTARSPEA